MINNDKVKELAEKSEDLRASIKEKTLGYITAGLGVVAGLAWNDAIKSLIDILIPLDKNKVGAKFIYALVITIVVVVVSVYLVKILSRKSE